MTTLTTGRSAHLPTRQPSPGAARRPALDGLRAVAVVAVAVYHFGGGSTSVLPGGFLGVDVFFVLSGYLITGLLLRERARAGRIDLLAFWARRVRRLMPALVLLLLAVTFWVWWATPPETWMRRRSDLLWSVAYLANWHFAATGEDYFAAYSGASPVRHFWSLAVEEQFYLVWPLLVVVACALAARSLGRRWSPPGGWTGPGVTGALCVLGIGVSALVMAAQYRPGDPTRAYYGTDGRVQELFVGALLAVTAGRFRIPRWAPPAGLVLLAVMMATLSDGGTPYYRGGALLASLATAAVIGGVEAEPGGRLARALSVRPAVALGRISYGVYLWHWPVVLAVPVPGGASPGEQVRLQAVRVLVTLVAATASYQLVERPFLEGRVPWLGRSRLRLTLAGGLALSLVAGSAQAMTTLPGSLERQVVDSSQRPCPGEVATDLVFCARVDAGPKAPVVAVLGDSTARALAPGLDTWARRAGVTWVQAGWQRCPATGLLVVPNGMSAPDPVGELCHRLARERIRQMLARYHPQTVLVGEFWTHHQRLLVGGRTLAPGTTEHADAERAALVSLVDDVVAAGGRVALLELPPPGETLGPVVAAGRPAGSARPLAPGGEYVAGYNAMLRDVAASRPASALTVSVDDVVCPGGECAPLQNGVLVRTDGVHYTSAYSRLLVPQLMARVDAGLGPRAGR